MAVFPTFSRKGFEKRDNLWGQDFLWFSGITKGKTVSRQSATKATKKICLCSDCLHFYNWFRKSTLNCDMIPVTCEYEMYEWLTFHNYPGRRFGLNLLNLNILTEIKLGKISMHHMAGKKQKQTPQNQSGCVCDFSVKPGKLEPTLRRWFSQVSFGEHFPLPWSLEQNTQALKVIVTLAKKEQQNPKNGCFAKNISGTSAIKGFGASP